MGPVIVKTLLCSLIRNQTNDTLDQANDGFSSWGLVLVGLLILFSEIMNWEKKNQCSKRRFKGWVRWFTIISLVLFGVFFLLKKQIWKSSFAKSVPFILSLVLLIKSCIVVTTAQAGGDNKKENNQDENCNSPMKHGFSAAMVVVCLILLLSCTIPQFLSIFLKCD